MADTYLYSAGDAGECIYFVSHGSMKVELSNDSSLLDSRAIIALQILLHKHKVHGEIHTAGDHFGEYCVVSRAGLRPESVKVMSGSEVYALGRADLWAIFQYLTYRERRSFIYELMTRVGERHHIQNPAMDAEPEGGLHGGPGTEDDDSRMKALYRLAYEVMTEIIDELNRADVLRSASDDEDHQRVLKSMLRQQSASGNRFSQRDLIDLFEHERSANPHANFSENALRSRLSSFNVGLETLNSESNSGRTSPRSRTASVSNPGGAVSSASPSPSPSLRPSVLAMAGGHSEMSVVDVDSDGSDEGAEDSGEGMDEVESTKARADGRKRSPSSSFVHKRIQQLSGAHSTNHSPSKELELEMQEIRSASPAVSSLMLIHTPTGSIRKSSAVRFDVDLPSAERGASAGMPVLTPTVSSRKGSAVRFDLDSPTLEASTPKPALGSAGKAVALQHRSNEVDYNVVRNALEIEGIVRQRRGSTTIIIPDGKQQEK